MIPIHNIPNESRQDPNADFFMIVYWGGTRKVTHTPHRHAFNELIFILSNGGQHEIDFKNYPIKSQNVHFVRAAQVHQINRTDEASGYSLLFSNNFLLQNPLGSPILQGLNTLMPMPNQPTLEIGEADYHIIKNILEQIRHEYQQPFPIWDTIRAYFYVIYTYLCRYKNKQPSNNTPKYLHQTIQNFFHLIEQHYTQQWTVSQYAAALFISPNYLNELCRQETEHNALFYIQTRLLTEAKRQLCYSDLPIKNIADLLGFQDIAYFSRFFKKHTQVSPTQYREDSQIR